MSRVMMALGAFAFSIDTAAYETLQRSNDYRWSQVDRVGRGPALQFLGPGTESFDLAGTIYPKWKGGWSQIDQLRELAAIGAPQMMVSGFGDVFGLYVIEKVQSNESLHLPGGRPRKVGFSLTLKRYGEDA